MERQLQPLYLCEWKGEFVPISASKYTYIVTDDVQKERLDKLSVPSRINKWVKYKQLWRSSLLKQHLPETQLLSPHSLWRMVEKYSQVVAKPVGGRKGNGVTVISKINPNLYEIHSENRKKYIRSKVQAYRYLRRLCGSNPCIIQRVIKRSHIGGRPFDFRVIVQRKKHSKQWDVTGKAAKVAARGYFVSNTTRKGTIFPVAKALSRSSLRGISSRKLQSRIEIVSKLSAQKLSSLFPSHRIYGIDVGLDWKGKAWVFEANLYPDMSHFHELGNRTILRRIMKYKRQ